MVRLILLNLPPDCRTFLVRVSFPVPTAESTTPIPIGSEFYDLELRGKWSWYNMLAISSYRRKTIRTRMHECAPSWRVCVPERSLLMSHYGSLIERPEVLRLIVSSV